MPNKYLNRLESLINEYRNTNLTQFKDPQGKKADFDDLIWHYFNPNTGRKTRYLGCRFNIKGKGSGLSYSDDLALQAPYNYLLKIWIIEVSNMSCSEAHKQDLVASARYALTRMKGDLFSQSEPSINHTLKHKKNKAFFNFCISNGLMPKYQLYGWPENDRDRTGHNIFDKYCSKLPSDHALLALGSIFSKVFEHVNTDGTVKTGKTVCMPDAITITFACLSLASPNRTSAETPLLPKQRLHSYSENNDSPVYYLDWKGSKGYKDNKNHILAVLAEPVDKALNYFYLASEPARALCRFYEKPNQSLKSLLGDFTIDPEREKHLLPTKHPNIFQLGYALGFYDLNAYVYVLKPGFIHSNTIGKNKITYFDKKFVHSLDLEDRISTSPNNKVSFACLNFLFGQTLLDTPFSNKSVISIAELQEWWFSHYKTTILPEFPVSYSTGESFIRLKNAMFCILGSSFYAANTNRGSGAKRYQKSYYSVVPLKSLGIHASQKLTGSNNSRGMSIFERYGYPAELNTSSNSLRHYANTLADISNIPIEIITSWSGRTNPEQTHTYIHTHDNDKADRVRAIINLSSNNKEHIRFVSERELSSTINLPASITSTGLCTQDLNTTPCNYLNDFISQCFMCSESCHIAGDQESIIFLEKDLSFQRLRLKTAEQDSRLKHSKAMQQWYVIHSNNISILFKLIDLMKNQPKGTIIRYSKNNNEFKLTDLKTKSITSVAHSLPDHKNHLKNILLNSETGTDNSDNPELHKLLTSFGITTEMN